MSEILKFETGKPTNGPDEPRIEDTPRGIVIYGAIKVSDLTAQFGRAEALGYDRVHTGIASVLGATFVLTNNSLAAGWVDDIDAEAAQRADGDAVLAWLYSARGGRSSWALAAVLGDERQRFAARGRLGHASACDYPHDGADLGRCIALLDVADGAGLGWRARLGEVAEAHPAWAGLVQVWPALEASYARERGSGSMPDTYRLMCDVLAEGEP